MNVERYQTLDEIEQARGNVLEMRRLRQLSEIDGNVLLQQLRQRRAVIESNIHSGATPTCGESVHGCPSAPQAVSSQEPPAADLSR